MKIPLELIEQFARGNGVIFVGTGLSQGAGLPSCADIVRKLATELEDCPTDVDHREIAQYYDIEYGRQRLVQKLRDQLNRLGGRPTVIHEILVKLPVSTIFTTNYDDLLEQALGSAKRRFTPVVSNVDASFWSADQLQLVKLHGDLNQPKSIIITTEDYERFASQRVSLARLLATTLQTCTVLFLGYDATDPDLALILTQVHDEVRDKTHNYARTLYTVQFGLNPFKAKRMERRGLKVVDLGSQPDNTSQNAALLTWLQRFHEQVAAEKTMKSSSKSSTDRIGVSEVQSKFEKIGYIFREQPVSVHGIDAQVEIVQDDILTGKLIAIQIKSGVSWFRETTDVAIVFCGDKAHLNYSLNHSLPVIIVLYNPETEDAYWELVSNDKVVETTKHWKLNVPLSQQIDLSSRAAFERLVGQMITRDSYKILSLRDTSHNGAKRYSVNILVNNSSRHSIINVTKQAIKYARQRMYYQNEITKQHWGDTPAHVVFLFVYTSLDHVRMTNWICRSLWIDEDLPAKFAPQPFKGENIGNGIVFEWSSSYKMLHLHSQQNTLVKEEYLDKMNSHLKTMKQLIAKAISLREDFEANRLTSSEYIKYMSELEPSVTDCYLSSTDIGLAPLECIDVSKRFQGTISYAHNVMHPFSEKGLSTCKEKNRKYLVRQALEYYRKELRRLEFELEKIQ